MKASKYTKLFQASDGIWLIFNSWTTALAELEPENLPFIRALLADPDGVPCDTAEKRGMREAMAEAHFLIDDEMDELSTLKADLMRDRFGQDNLYLTIAPTLNCNFRCDYCFEEHLKINMSKPVEDALVKWVEHIAKPSKELHVSWYGGEPLLPQAVPVVERLSKAFVKIATTQEMKYSAHLVTNGYLLSRATLEPLVAAGLERVQVTLDGPPEIHDKRRHLVGGQETFWRIISNVKETLDLVGIQVRINVDQRNAMATLDVLDILKKEGLYGKVRFYLAQVTADGATCGNIHEACFSSETFAEKEIEIYQEAARRGYYITRYPARQAGAYCMAERQHGYVVAPNGSIFKCWHEVTQAPDRAIASVLDGQQPFQRLNEDRWLGWNALEKAGCRACEIVPLCHGGCPLEAMKHPDHDHGACEHFKYHLEPLLELHYKNQGRDVPSEAPRRSASGEAEC